jgi:hypothetical protein
LFCIIRKEHILSICKKFKKLANVISYNDFKCGMNMTEEGYPLEAIILVTAKLGELWKVADEAKKIEGVIFAKAVAGRYDVVVHAQTNKLAWVIARLHSIKGVANTESLITIDARFE